jgi:hypothetical protein
MIGVTIRAHFVYAEHHREGVVVLITIYLSYVYVYLFYAVESRVTRPVTPLAHHQDEGSLPLDDQRALIQMDDCLGLTVLTQTDGFAEESRPSDIQKRLDVLRATFRKRWTRNTSADAWRWTPDNPSYGQCAVTSLIIQDLFGGCLLRARVNGSTHYWNRLPWGEEVDLTREQFGGLVDIPAGEERSREHVLSFPETARRYRSLAESVRQDLVSH